jgi:Zn-dependent protease
MKQTVSLGRVAGIPVGMHWSVLVMVTMIGWLLGGQVLPETIPDQPAAAHWAVAVPCAVAFMAALLAHEFAHSLVARRPAIRHKPPGSAIT